MSSKQQQRAFISFLFHPRSAGVGGEEANSFRTRSCTCFLPFSCVFQLRDISNPPEVFYSPSFFPLSNLESFFFFFFFFFSVAIICWASPPPRYFGDYTIGSENEIVIFAGEERRLALCLRSIQRPVRNGDGEGISKMYFRESARNLSSKPSECVCNLYSSPSDRLALSKQ